MAQFTPRTIDLEHCPVCGGKAYTKFFSAPDRLHGIHGEFVYVTCEACGSVFQNPRVVDEDLPGCYPNDYYTHEPEIANLSEDEVLTLGGTGIRDRFRRSIAAEIMDPKSSRSALARFFARSRTVRERVFNGLVIDEFLPRGGSALRALEVGCGSGDLLARLKALGWKCEGLELDSIAASIARERSGCPVGVGTLEEFDEPAEKYDLIVLHHVFEHLSKPIETIKAFKRLLNPDGRAVLIYPNQDSLGAKLFREFWLHWDPPRHLFFASRSGMQELASKYGFRFSARTGSRAADLCSAISRSHRSRANNGQKPVVDRLDRLYKRVQQLMILFGFHVGDEILVTLRNS